MSEGLAASADWTLITVTFNSAAQLESSWALSGIGQARWLVVDNASTDASASVAERLGAEVIRLHRNVGFGAANNVGLQHVTSEWVGFVNPDVTVADPGDLARLVAVSDANAALVAPQLVNPDGSEQANARGLPFLLDKIANRSVTLPGSRLQDYARIGLSGPTYVAWVIGAALLGRTETVRKLGGWDERFFIYYEDHDIGLRAWRAGVPVVVDPSVRWRHEWQRATTRARWGPWKHELVSMQHFYRKYPALLIRGRLRSDDGLSRLPERVWAPAREPPAQV